jgi:hypothetical protein
MFHSPQTRLTRDAHALESSPELPAVPPAGDAPQAARRDGAAAEGAAAGRRPRIAIMGEFSAGKSTLSNLLMGAPALPTRVTATQLPPVWISHGSGAAHGVDLDGQRFALDLDRLEDIDPACTRYLSIERPAEVLQVCDLIDFPGISDPSMPAEVWQRTAPLADAVLWCTHATQAWRQSEAAAWEEMPEALRARSFLLLTRFDKITEPKDRRRVLARVRRETDGLFAGVFPVSLTRAIASADDAAAFADSGAQALLEALLDMVMRLSSELGRPIPIAAAPSAETAEPGRGADAPAVASLDARRDPLPPASDVPPAGRIVPRRVRPRSGAARKARPAAPADDGPAFPTLG